MTTHRFVATEWHNVLGTLPPAIRVASGDTVITETLDAWGIDNGVTARIDQLSPEQVTKGAVVGSANLSSESPSPPSGRSRSARSPLRY